MADQIVRVLRVIEYTGPRDRVEKQLLNSINGPVDFGNGVTIRCASLGAYMEVLDEAAVNDRAIAIQSRQIPSVGEVHRG